MSTIRAAYIEKLVYRDDIVNAIEASRNTSGFAENLIRWCTPKFIQTPAGIQKEFSSKFLDYCSNPANARYTKGRSPSEISLSKQREQREIIAKEALNRKSLLADLATVEASLKDLRLQLPPAEQVLSLQELQALQAGEQESPRFDDTQGAKLAAADTTENANTEDMGAAIDAALANS